MYETSFLLANDIEKCEECNQPIFDFDATPEMWKHKTCNLDTCQESIHEKCHENHIKNHPILIKTINDLERLRSLFGINKNIEVDRCILCKRVGTLKEQLCNECQNI